MGGIRSFWNARGIGQSPLPSKARTWEGCSENGRRVRFAVAMPGVPPVTKDPEGTLVRFAVRAQPVDATPSNPLIGQHFPMENRFVRLYSIRP